MASFTFLQRMLLYGLGYGLFVLCGTIFVMDTPPANYWGWVKLVALTLGSASIGCYTYSRDPDAKWGELPKLGGKNVMLLISLLSFTLAGCAGTLQGNSDDRVVQDFRQELEALKAVKLEDVKLALQWATEDQDPLAVPCYTFIAQALENAELPLLDRHPVGAISAVYLARSVRRDIQGFGSSNLRQGFLLNCAGLWAERRDLLIKLGVRLVR